MKHPDFKLYFAVFSHGRPNSVKEVTKYMGTDCTWYVGKGERRAYEKAGARRVVDSGNLPVSRNVALDDAWRIGCTCVQVSDDLRRFSLATSRMVPLTALSAAMLVSASLDACQGVYLGGGTSTSNPYMAIGLRTGNKLPLHPRPIVQFDTLVLGDFSVVKPCGLYFDENTPVKEDYEYTLRHLLVYGKVLRLNYLLQDFRHRTNPGGANLERWGPEKTERRSYDYLLNRWGKVLSTVIKRGPTSSDLEIRINWRNKEQVETWPIIHPRFPRLRYPRIAYEIT
jgi:hypothetical protein